MQRDPIGYNAGDVSLYRYVGNMSTRHFDPFGLKIISLESTGRQPKIDPTTGQVIGYYEEIFTLEEDDDGVKKCTERRVYDKEGQMTEFVYDCTRSYDPDFDKCRPLPKQSTPQPPQPSFSFTPDFKDGMPGFGITGNFGLGDYYEGGITGFAGGYPSFSYGRGHS